MDEFLMVSALLWWWEPNNSPSPKMSNSSSMGPVNTLFIGKLNWGDSEYWAEGQPGASGQTLWNHRPFPRKEHDSYPEETGQRKERLACVHVMTLSAISGFEDGRQDCDSGYAEASSSKNHPGNGSADLTWCHAWEVYSHVGTGS